MCMCMRMCMCTEHGSTRWPDRHSLVMLPIASHRHHVAITLPSRLLGLHSPGAWGDLVQPIGVEESEGMVHVL